MVEMTLTTSGWLLANTNWGSGQQQLPMSTEILAEAVKGSVR